METLTLHITSSFRYADEIWDRAATRTLIPGLGFIGALRTFATRPDGSFEPVVPYERVYFHTAVPERR